MTPSAPGRFSTTTGCAHRADKRCANSLAVKSEALPAGTGRIRCTARSGQASAQALKEHVAEAGNSKTEIMWFIVLPYRFAFCLRRPAPGRTYFSFAVTI